MEKKTINLKEASFTQAINISAQWCKEWEEDLPTFGLPSKVTNPDL